MLQFLTIFILWLIRYYYLSFGEQMKSSHCVDIGVRIRGRPIDNEWAQLGAISVHEGEVRRLKIQLQAVSGVEFCFRVIKKYYIINNCLG